MALRAQKKSTLDAHVGNLCDAISIRVPAAAAVIELFAVLYLCVHAL
jgi:hypothetical protein